MYPFTSHTIELPSPVLWQWFWRSLAAVFPSCATSDNCCLEMPGIKPPASFSSLLRPLCSSEGRVAVYGWPKKEKKKRTRLLKTVSSALSSKENKTKWPHSLDFLPLGWVGNIWEPGWYSGQNYGTQSVVFRQPHLQGWEIKRSYVTTVCYALCTHSSHAIIYNDGWFSRPFP